jgi:DNA-binding transcriptional LysR family regulator
MSTPSEKTRRQHRVSLDSLRLLDAIDRHGSFAAAAHELCVVTSSITHAIQNLEENLGITLFDRSGRRARFTSKGRALLERGRGVLARAAAFDEEVQLIATGWEARLVIAVDEVMRVAPMMAAVGEFTGVAPNTSLHITREAAAGSWDALMSGRADLIVGAPAGGPAGGGCESVPMYRIDFALVVAAGHPLAARQGVISHEEISQHRAVVIGDTTRHLPHLQYGLLDNRLCLSVPDNATKLEAILLGIGCGFMPLRAAEPLVRDGRLVVLQVEAPHPPGQSTLAWRSGETGRALRWWIEKFTQPSFVETLFA